jgi:protein TonB
VNRLRPSRWTIAFLLAMAAHLAVLLYATARFDTEPVWRGGGETGGGDGVVVRLGAPAGTDGAPESRATADPAPAPPQPPPTIAEPVPEPEPVVAPEPTPEATPEPAVPVIVAEPAPPVAAAPVPKPAAKPDRPEPPPRAEAPRPPPAPSSPSPEKKPAEKKPAETAAEAVKQQVAASGVSFGSESSRLGTASGEREGEVRELTYGDRVMLWLQRHGEYPLPAARYGLKDTVTVEFAINRRGVILYYRLVQDSRWYMLNTAVRQMMDRSSPVPPIPPDIPDSELTFTVPVHFSPP